MLRLGKNRLSVFSQSSIRCFPFCLFHQSSILCLFPLCRFLESLIGSFPFCYVASSRPVLPEFNLQHRLYPILDLKKCHRLKIFGQVRSLVWSRTWSTPSPNLKADSATTNTKRKAQEAQLIPKCLKTLASRTLRVRQRAKPSNMDYTVFLHHLWCNRRNDWTSLWLRPKMKGNWILKNLGSKCDSKLGQVQRSEQRKWWWSQYGSPI